VLAWTGGRALVATGSPNPAVGGYGPSRIIGQSNNVFVFPGVGLGAVVAEARELTDEAFLVAARALAGSVTDERLATGAMYPPIGELRTVARTIAIDLVRHLRDSGYGRQYRDEEVEPAVDAAMWFPEYRRYVPLED
jgi:malic enzyme